MSESDATEALLARLSYQASLRAGEHARRQANKFSVQKVAKIALMFCLLVGINLISWNYMWFKININIFYCSGLWQTILIKYH